MGKGIGSSLNSGVTLIFVRYLTISPSKLLCNAESLEEKEKEEKPF